MFTGIIEALEPVLLVKTKSKNLSVRIRKPKGWKFREGQSLSIDGVCTTVVSWNRTSFAVEYMPETLAKTTLQFVKKGTVLNLERPITLESALDGYLIQGHVDACGPVLGIGKSAGRNEFTLETPLTLQPYIAHHGAITVNGVSLTIARKTKKDFTVALIPYTLTHTNLKWLKKGSLVNLEVDLVARYVVSALEHATMAKAKKKTYAKK